MVVASWEMQVSLCPPVVTSLAMEGKEVMVVVLQDGIVTERVLPLESLALCEVLVPLLGCYVNLSESLKL